MLLYIHVPFCRSKCHYCAFFSQPLGEGGHDRLISGYLTSLRHEIELWAGRLGNVPVETVFFGGGTPSLLPPKGVARILESISKHFSLASNPEITMEANPDSALAPFWMRDVYRAGVSRLSLGIQSLDDRTLALLGRIHTAREAMEAYDAARVVGFGSVSVDMMWGLPGEGRGQQLRHWLRDLRTLASMRPDHLSAYNLTLEPGSPLAERMEKGDFAAVGEKEQADMFMQGAEYLESQGLMQYEISNFARLGFVCRHNLAYWEGTPYIGLGPAAASTLGTMRWTNPENLAEWQAAVKSGAIGTVKAGAMEILDPLTLRKEMLMLSLRTAKGLSLARWKKQTGRSFLRDHGSLVTLLVKNNLATTRNGTFRLTRPGMLVSNTIIEHFFRDMGEEGAA